MTVAVPPAVEVIQGAVLFTDIVGFTEFTALRGDAAALALLTRQEAIVQQALPPQARIVKELGDGLLLWFADACAALDFAIAVQGRYESETVAGNGPLWVRMGLHWGQQTVRRGDVLGHDVNVASRIVNQAAPGEILLSENTVKRVREGNGDYAFEELGPVVMKGIPTPIRLFRASRESGF